MTWPSLYQINTRFWLYDQGAATLDDISDAELDRLAAQGFEWIWLLGVWQTGALGLEYSRSLFPHLPPTEVCGSCFSITAYEGAAYLGGSTALKRMRDRLHQRGLRLMLDFVANHTAPDHPWVAEHRDYYVPGNDRDGLAYGRDPNFPGWPDTLQLNYGNPALEAAMIAELQHVATFCDGVRCDMAMLLLPEVFHRTWDIDIQPFWPNAIAAVHEKYPHFLLMAEVYWDLEWTLLQQGFDFAYDKRLYDRLHQAIVPAVHDHLIAGIDYQARLARFLENHDEPRAAQIFPVPQHQAAALITYTVPGLRFFHYGQLKGLKLQASIHLCHRPSELADPAIQAFYAKLLPLLPQGGWSLLDTSPACEGNESYRNFIAYRWPGILVIVNYAPQPSQCYIEVKQSGRYRLTDAFSGVTYEREGPNLYIALQAWGFNYFVLA